MRSTLSVAVSRLERFPANFDLRLRYFGGIKYLTEGVFSPSEAGILFHALTATHAGKTPHPDTRV